MKTATKPLATAPKRLPKPPSGRAAASAAAKAAEHSAHGLAAAHAPAVNDTGVLAAAVRRLRTLRGLTLAELSLRTGISQSALSKIENGHLSPTYEKVVALANGFEVDVSELFAPRAAAAPTGRRGITRKGQGVFYPTAQ